MKTFVLESCNATWLFDIDRMRYRRVLRGIEVEDRPVATQWRPYFGLDLKDDSEAFVVFLNPEGTHLIQSWRHTRECTQCGAHETSELDLAEIAASLALADSIQSPGSL